MSKLHPNPTTKAEKAIDVVITNEEDERDQCTADAKTARADAAKALANGDKQAAADDTAEAVTKEQRASDLQLQINGKDVVYTNSGTMAAIDKAVQPDIDAEKKLKADEKNAAAAVGAAVGAAAKAAAQAAKDEISEALRKKQAERQGEREARAAAKGSGLK
jgi:hypothetical protein